MERSYGSRRCKTAGVRAVCGNTGSAGRLGDGAWVVALSTAEKSCAFAYSLEAMLEWRRSFVDFAALPPAIGARPRRSERLNSRHLGKCPIRPISRAQGTPIQLAACVDHRARHGNCRYRFRSVRRVLIGTSHDADARSALISVLGIVIPTGDSRG
jgi:hypothetical protein